MFAKPVSVFLFVVTAVCAVATSSVARDVAKAKMSVTVYSVADDNLSNGATAALMKMPGVTAIEALNGGNAAGPATAIIMSATENAQGLVEGALSGSGVETTTFSDIVPLGKKLPFEAHRQVLYMKKVILTRDSKGVVHKDYRISEAKEGIAMSFTPKMNGGILALDSRIENSELTGPNNGFKNVSFEGTTIQLVNKSVRSIAHLANMPGKSGTVVYVVPGSQNHQYVVTVVSASKL